MKYEIALIGAGQLGSRYLQGMAHCSMPLKINVVDPSQYSLTIAQSRWQEACDNESIHQVEFFNTFKDIREKSIDIAIVSTNSEKRAELISDLSKNLNIRYWIIEKVLAQSDNELTLISETLKNSSGAWVNTSRRIMKWYQEIIQSIPKESPITFSVIGSDWGLACNAIHFLDLAVWFTGEKLVSINTDQLASKWHKAKREGYWEIFGVLEAFYSGGSKLILESNSGLNEYEIKFIAEDFSWTIQESAGIARNSSGELIEGKLSFQSEITGTLIESIINTGNCELSCVDESISLHKKLIAALLNDWNLKMPDKLVNLPIT